MHRKLLVAYLFLIFCSFQSLLGKIPYDSLRSIYNRHLEEAQDIDTNTDLRPDLLNFLEEVYSDSQISETEIREILARAASAEKSQLLDEGIYLLSSVVPWLKNQPSYLAFFHTKLGELYRSKKKSINAIEQFMKAGLLLEKVDEIEELARIYFNISLINMGGNNPEIGISYSDQGLNLLKSKAQFSKSDSNTLRGLYSVKGLLLGKVGEYEAAIEATNLSIEISEAMNDTIRAAISNGNKAIILYKMGNFNAALPLLQKDFETSFKNGLYLSAFNAGIYICKVHFTLGNNVLGFDWFDKISQMLEESSISNIASKIEYFNVAADVAQLKGEKDKEIEYLRKYQEVDLIRDSIASANDITQLQEKYLLEKEVTKMELLQTTNQLQASHLRLRTSILILIALALIIVLWYVFILRQKNKKIDKLNELLEEKVSDRTSRLLEINKELDTYLYRASHDIRRPIRTLLGLNNVSKLNQSKEELEKLFDQVHFTALNMDKMLFKLQMAYDLNNEHKTEKVQLNSVLKDCLKDMALEIEAHNAKIDIVLPKNNVEINANTALLRIILDNIIENAILYQNHGNPEVKISIDAGKYYFYIHIKDNGYGIPTEYYKQVFEAYFKLSNKTQGSGLGLFLAFKAVTFLGGEIAIQSEINSGSQFTVKIPLSPK